MNILLPDVLTEQMLARICCEFAEMPGMQVTSKQAQRLWGLDEATCAHLLNLLVEAKFLSRTGLDKDTGLDRYGRVTER